MTSPEISRHDLIEQNLDLFFKVVLQGEEGLVYVVDLTSDGRWLLLGKEGQFGSIIFEEEFESITPTQEPLWLTGLKPYGNPPTRGLVYSIEDPVEYVIPIASSTSINAHLPLENSVF